MKKYAFTMAEILISLTIIGIIAAITLPALQGNINEKTWATQRKALYSRLSQAIALMPSLNGYGATGTTAQIKAKTAEVFITDGLSKVFKINNICNKDHLVDCGIPNKMTILGGGNTINTPVKLTDLNPEMMSAANPDVSKYMINSDAAAFETANGESILTFYNPYCAMKDVNVPGVNGSGLPGYYNKIYVCANFIYDLNGSKGPNSVGKDIGFITALYPIDSNVVMANPMKLLDTQYKQADAIQACRNIDQDYTIPNGDEAASLYYNNNLHSQRRQTWTSESLNATTGYAMTMSIGVLWEQPKNTPYYVTCIKR